MGISRRDMLIASASLSIALTSGCAMQQEQVQQDLSNPKRIHCATAEGDIRVLQSEKANLVQRVAEGATAITPAGAVMGILTGTEGTKLQVATGDYNAMIDQRIADIRRTCGM